MNFFFILMKNGTGEREKLDNSEKLFLLLLNTIILLDIGELEIIKKKHEQHFCASNTFSTHIGQKKKRNSFFVGNVGMCVSVV